jgi:molybdopterin-containing oxidoreductase family membrane subunit
MPPASPGQVDRDILRAMQPPGRLYYASLALVAAVIGWGAYAWSHQVRTGLAVAGLNNPVGWGAYITNFVFWVGIAHSGTLISAILFLVRARWRTAVYRSAEAMTVFAIMTAGLFPLIHLGRPWVFYWLLPYPNQRNLWPNFQSPLMWDVFAVGTYMTVSVTFFLVGLIPDLATARDRAAGWRRRFYGLLSLGWRGTDREWRHYRSAYLFLAALATPLVVSVHSVVSWDFAMSIVPGWHSTIFAPYFVAGAIHSGLAMVIVILLPLRRIFRLEAYLEIRHFENLAKLVIVTGLIVGYAYGVEYFLAWYSGNVYEQAVFLDRATGHYAPEFWLMVAGNAGLPLLFFLRRVRTSPVWLCAISIGINIGMWFERYVIIVASLAHSYLPFSWGLYRPTWVELSITAGSFAWFFFWFLLFAKFLPAVSTTEIKQGLAEAAE